MDNPFKSVTELPGPVQAVLLLGSGAGLAALVMAVQQNSRTWQIIALLIIGVVVAMVLFKVALSLWDKRKSSPFAQKILGAASARGATDPNQKAKLDDLRTKFDEGMRIFKAAGKDVYGLPWYLVVGVPGSGKTEMIRRSNVGFPQDLNEPRQGVGGTHSMNWWFTNEAVILDTAGRMFMEEGAEGTSTEWKEFLKMLRQGRANCPINGLLLVIPAESLLEHDAKKIEEYASTIRRQLDSVQRTLEVRYPVTVLVTKCDRIVGFKEFFDSIPDTAMQQQMLGWSNPASLDDPFKPEELDEHMKGVREKLLKRRAGLLQNPVHTVDPNERRIDQIDEMFELPANLMQVVPKLKQYLDIVFSTGQWSMRPLFLRGIYFTSALRKGNALDMALARALGIDVAQLSDGREKEEDKAFFLRDVFISKVFKESGLVTNAAHIGESIARQRKLIIGTALVGALVVGAAALIGASGYRSSLGKITPTWEGAALGSSAEASAKWPLFERDKDDKLTYVGKLPVGDVGVRSDEDTTRSGALRQLGDATAQFADPWAAKPALWLRGITAADFRQSQVAAHRAIVERQLLVPLLDETRAKLAKEKNWDQPAVNALAQLIRLTTIFEGATPRTAKAPKDGEALVNIQHLAEYAMAENRPFKENTDPELIRLQEAVKKAYPVEFPTSDDIKSSPLTDALFQGSREQATESLIGALNRMREDLKSNVPADTRLAKLRGLMSELKAFSDIEKTNADKLAWLSGGGGPGVEPDAKKTIAGYAAFSQDFRNKRDELSKRAQAAMLVVTNNFKMEELARPALLSELQEQWRLEVEKRLGSLTDQLRTPPAAPAEGAAAAPTLLAKLDKLFDPQDGSNLTQSVKLAVEAAGKNDAALLKEVGPFMAALPKQGTLPADVKSDDLFFEVTRVAYVQAANALDEAEKFPAATKAEEPPVYAQAKVLREKFTTERNAVWQREVEAPRQWIPATPDGEKRRAESLDALRKVRELSELRATYGVADAVLKDPVWTSGETLEGGIREQWNRMVKEVELSGNPNPAITGATRLARVPLTSLDVATGVLVKGEYHYLAAAPVVRSWGELRDLAVPKSEGALPQMVDAANMRGRFQTAPAVKAIEDYAKRYAIYWKTIAESTAMPKEFTTADLADFDVVKVGDAADRLKRLKDQLMAAAKAFEGLGVKETDALSKQVARDYMALETDASLPQFAVVAKAWRGVMAKGDAEAKSLVREALSKNTFGPQFATGFGVTDDKYLKYQDEFVLRSLTLLQGGQDRVGTAWNQLTGSFKGVPLARGTGLPTLTLDDVKRAAENAALLERSGGGAASSDVGAGLNITLQNRVKEVFGRNYLEKDETRTWLAGVKSVSAALGDGGARVEYELDSAATTGADGVRLAADVYTVGQLWVSDVFVRSENIKTGGVLKDGIALPAPGKVEIRLSIANQNQQITNADDTIVLSGAQGEWNMLSAILTAPPSRLKPGDSPTSGSIFILTQKGAAGAWFKYKLVCVRPLPMLDEWPKASAWPAQ
jgi:hypothetical protein